MTAKDSIWAASNAAPRPPRTSRQVTVPASLRVLLVSLLGGIVFDLAVRSGIAGAGGVLAVLVLTGGLLVAGRPANRQAWALAATAPLFGVWLALRTSPWLLPLDVLAVLGLLLLAATLARDGSIVDLGLGQALARARHAVWHVGTGPAYLRGAAGGRERSILFGLAMALPVVAVLGTLLSSADVVFASFFDWISLPLHILLIAVGAWGTAGLLRLAWARAADQPAPAKRRLGGIEGLILLGAVSAVLLAFAAAQLIALSQGGQRVIETAGLTYADYARSGFFQLLAVAALTVALLLAVRAWIRAESDSLSWWALMLSEVTVVLTLLLAIVAFRRLGLYIDAFGLTMLRLFAAFFTGWIGVALVLLSAHLAGAWRRRAWFGPACAGAGLAVLFALNVLNPEAVVVRHNLTRLTATTGGERSAFDSLYAASLSEDAVPVMASVLDALPSGERDLLISTICPPSDPAFHGWAAFNLARSRAQQARETICSG